MPIRARDPGLPFAGEPGTLNAITDIAGLHVGMTTLIEDRPRPGRPRPVRTGVTAIIPHADRADPTTLYAGVHRFNGNGETTGTHWIAGGGWFFGPVLITNTHAVGRAHHAAIAWMTRRSCRTSSRASGGAPRSAWAGAARSAATARATCSSPSRPRIRARCRWTRRRICGWRC